VDGVTATTYTATGLIADTIYVFKVESRTLVGFSEYSVISTIRAASVPD
jgi:hypothetical protein